MTLATNWVAPQEGSTVKELIDTLPCLRTDWRVQDAQTNLQKLMRSRGEHTRTNLQLVPGFTCAVDYDFARMAKCHCNSHA